MATKLIPLEHPGIFLKEEFMEPLEVSAYRISKDTNISNMAISEIVRGKRSITQGLVYAYQNFLVYLKAIFHVYNSNMILIS